MRYIVKEYPQERYGQQNFDRRVDYRNRFTTKFRPSRGIYSYLSAWVVSVLSLRVDYVLGSISIEVTSVFLRGRSLKTRVLHRSHLRVGKTNFCYTRPTIKQIIVSRLHTIYCSIVNINISHKSIVCQ